MGIRVAHPRLGPAAPAPRGPATGRVSAHAWSKRARPRDGTWSPPPRCPRPVRGTATNTGCRRCSTSPGGCAGAPVPHVTPPGTGSAGGAAISAAPLAAAAVGGSAIQHGLPRLGSMRNQRVGVGCGVGSWYLGQGCRARAAAADATLSAAPLFGAPVGGGMQAYRGHHGHRQAFLVRADSRYSRPPGGRQAVLAVRVRRLPVAREAMLSSIYPELDSKAIIRALCG